MAQLLLRLVVAALFVFAGVVHFLKTDLFLAIMPPAIPFPRFCVLFSGICELLGGIGLLIPERHVQILTGFGLVLLLIAVFPANIYMAAENIKVHGIPSQPWMAWARLPLQPLLILVVLWMTRLWPFLPAE